MIEQSCDGIKTMIDWGNITTLTSIYSQGIFFNSFFLGNEIQCRN